MNKGRKAVNDWMKEQIAMRILYALCGKKLPESTCKETPASLARKGISEKANSFFEF